MPFPAHKNRAKGGIIMTYTEMLALARKNLNPQERGEYCSFGFVSAVIEAANGKCYTGVNVDLACGLGYCAERNAAGSMLTDGETVVRRVVCVGQDGAPMPPCGCCREFLALLSPENENTEFLLEEEPLRTETLGRLRLFPWEK